jgi:putative peptide modification system cyclase
VNAETSAGIESDVTGTSTSVLRTVVVCDLVDSTALVERLGDQRAADLFRKHDRITRTLMQPHGGREIDKTDGFLLIFERPIQAVAFALAYQHELAELGKQEKIDLAARIGIHVGDVVLWDNSLDDVKRGAKPMEVEGLVKPVAARLMGLALPRQILLSGTAYDIAHRAQGELGARLANVRWRTHGRYRFKGVPDLVPVFEVGEEGIAPLKAPAWSSKAHREMPFWRRPMMIGAEIALVAILIAVPVWYILRPAPAIAFANRDWVVVGDLKNLTGETNFDASLEAAFRIALEQSRYVNVMPDLKVRETVKLMQRDPEQTKVDRAIGSEIAIRDGARALILPTIAEIGGRVRLTAEVVDPQTQTTVWSESADGAGEASVLPSIDTINRQLRARLGEAMSTVSENSRPLEKVATNNLDALRTYSLALKHVARAKFADALTFLHEALKLDPQLAAAHLQIARIMANSGRNEDARKELELALSNREHLTTRDTLLAEAHLASIQSPRASLDKWKLIADTYPDFSVGTGTYAYLAWNIGNRYDDDVFAKARASAQPQNPNRGPATHLLGILNLGSERYAEALGNFKDAEANGFGFKPYHASTFAAQRNYDEAEKLLPATPTQFDANAALGTINELLRISLQLARGDAAATTTALQRARQIGGAGAAFTNALGDNELAIFGVDAAARPRALTALADARQAFKPDDAIQSRASGGRVLVLAYLAARAGDATAAKTAVEDVERRMTLADFPVLAALDAVANAQISLAKGDAANARTVLLPLIDGSEPCIVHVVLMDAYTRESDYKHALEHAQWLAAHRGRAYAEYNLDKALMPFNVAQSNLAWLSAAELSAKLGDQATARSSLARFKQDWRDDGQPAATIARVKAIQLALESASP